MLPLITIITNWKYNLILINSQGKQECIPEECVPSASVAITRCQFKGGDWSVCIPGHPHPNLPTHPLWHTTWYTPPGNTCPLPQYTHPSPLVYPPPCIPPGRDLVPGMPTPRWDLGPIIPNPRMDLGPGIPITEWIWDQAYPPYGQNVKTLPSCNFVGGRLKY